MNYNKIILIIIVMLFTGTKDSYSMDQNNNSSNKKSKLDNDYNLEDFTTISTKNDKLGLEIIEIINSWQRDQEPLEFKVLEKIQALINLGANLDIRSKCMYEATALIDSCFFGMKNVATLLINSGANIILQDKNGETAFTLLFKNIKKNNISQKMDLVKVLINKCNNLYGQNYTELYINMRSTNTHETPLINCCNTLCEDIKTVSFLINNKADINAQNKHGRTALMIACFNINKEIVELLLKNGADIYITDSLNNTAIDHAKNQKKSWNKLTEGNRNNKINEIIKLIKNQVKLIDKLAKSIEEKDIKLIKIIVTKHPNLVNENGDSALQIASKGDDFEIIKLIAKIKLSLLNKKNRQGKTPLHENPQIILHLIISGLINPK